ncbi:MAG TPA: ester cyclase [Chloroflexota bacterium]
MRRSGRPSSTHGTSQQTRDSEVRRLIEEACNGGNLSVLEEALAAPAGVGAPEAPLSRLPQLLIAFRATVPDARWTIEEQIAQDETVMTRLAVTGTFSGPLLGLAPPGRPATLRGVAISRFAAERLVELRFQADLLGFLQQLGVMPRLDLDQAVAVAQITQAAALASSGQAEISAVGVMPE